MRKQIYADIQFDFFACTRCVFSGVCHAHMNRTKMGSE